LSRPAWRDRLVVVLSLIAMLIGFVALVLTTPKPGLE
jgi:hypothetical protein